MIPGTLWSNTASCSEPTFLTLKLQACQAHLQQDGWSENGGAIERQVIQTPGARSARQRLEYSTIKGTGV